MIETITAFLAMPMILIIGYACFCMGRASAELPDEAEMLRRIKEMRVKRRLESEVAREVDKEVAF